MSDRNDPCDMLVLASSRHVLWILYSYLTSNSIAGKLVQTTHTHGQAKRRRETRQLGLQ